MFRALVGCCLAILFLRPSAVRSIRVRGCPLLFDNKDTSEIFCYIIGKFKPERGTEIGQLRNKCSSWISIGEMHVTVQLKQLSINSEEEAAFIDDMIDGFLWGMHALDKQTDVLRESLILGGSLNNSGYWFDNSSFSYFRRRSGFLNQLLPQYHYSVVYNYYEKRFGFEYLRDRYSVYKSSLFICKARLAYSKLRLSTNLEHQKDQLSRTDSLGHGTHAPTPPSGQQKGQSSQGMVFWISDEWKKKRRRGKVVLRSSDSASMAVLMLVVCIAASSLKRF